MRHSFYPATPMPENQPSLRPSGKFRRRTYSVMLSIFLFCCLYLTLLALCTGFMVGGTYMGIIAIASQESLVEAVLGGVLITIEVLFLAFFIRFVFAVNKSGHPHRIKITPEEQPRLFEFIRQLAHDTKAPLPHNVYLLPGASTGMVYTTSFWNIFWPARKNLEIGMGLVNALSVVEFKAILAHEFGHFSRRSLGVGSYAYTANRVLYKLAYERDWWDILLDKRRATGGLLGFLTMVIQGMTHGVRTLLRWAYGGVYQQYLPLSREMEYHADRIAISVAGHAATISALRRSELGSQAYEHGTVYLNQLAELGKKTEDVYACHRTILSRLSNQYGLDTSNNLPQVRESNTIKIPLKSRITTRNQWAAHPTRRERERNIQSYSVVVPDYSKSAWKLFKNPSLLRRALTRHLYEVTFPGQSFRSLSSTDFATYLEQEEGRHQVSSAYHGFYDGRFLQPFDLQEAITKRAKTEGFTFSMIYNEGHYKKIAAFFADQRDFETLQHIQSGVIHAHHFDHNGKKCFQKDIGTLIRLLNGDLARQKLWLTELDQHAFLWHYCRAKEAGEVTEYVARYQMLMSLQEAYQNFSENHDQLDYWQQQLAKKEDWDDQAARQLAQELSNVEVSFKSNLRACDAANRIEDMLSEEQRMELIPYLRSEQAYYLKVSEFDEEAFLRFNSLVYDLWTATRLAYKQALKSLTDYQLRLQVMEESAEFTRLQG